MLADFEAQAAAGQVSVVEVAGQLVGLIVMSREADHLFIENVAVWPAHQGRGHGRRLLRHAEREARRLGLEEIRLYTEVRMTENLALYPAIGYEEFDRRAEGVTGGSTSGNGWDDPGGTRARRPASNGRRDVSSARQRGDPSPWPACMEQPPTR